VNNAMGFAKELGMNMDPIATQQLTDFASRSTTSGIYPELVAPAPDLVDAKALACLLNPENEGYRVPTSGSARRTATMRVPYKLDAVTRADGSYRIAIFPFAFA